MFTPKIVCIFLIQAVLALADERWIGGERIVTDEASTTWQGAPVDYRYSEAPGYGEHTSSPGCPKSIDGYPWVLYGWPPRCYLAGYKGPCGNYMKLFSISGHQYGVCDCQCFDSAESEFGCSSDNSPPSPSQSYCKIGGKGIHVARTSHGRYCAPLFQQNGCWSGQWTVMRPGGTQNQLQAVCEWRQCQASPSGGLGEFTFFDEVTHQCKQNGAPCDQAGERYEVSNADWRPTCLPRISCSFAPNVIRNSCQTNYVYSNRLGRCIRKFSGVKDSGSIG